MPIDFEVLFKALPGLYLVLRPDLTIAAVSDAYLNATMTRREDILGQGIFDIFPDNPDDPTADGVRNLRESLQRVLTLRRPDSMAVQKYDVKRPAAAGGGFEERYWSPINSPVIDGHGDILFIVHRVEDVTEFINLKNLGHEREREADDLRQRAEKMEAEVFHRARALEEANRALAESKIQLLQINESLERRVAERTRQLEAEISERERTQEALRETQKLEAIGRLAGGIAHDFNNLLTVIEGNSELLLVRSRDAEDVRGLQAIERAAERGAQLTRQLLAFSRRQTLRPEVVDLKKRSANMTDMLARAFRGDIRIVTTFADDLWPVECDVGELELALLNICVNARDAMPNGGLVRIDARNITVRDAPVGKDSLVGDFVTLSIADTGSGIPADVLTHVFEPFFTTKEIGRGTGLGLSQVYGFAEQAEGGTTIESEVGRGTTVTLYLPRTRSNLAAAPADDHTTHARGTGSILMVEDDDDVAATSKDLLRMIGYTVHHVRDARTALTLLLGGQTFNVLFSDIVMPGGMSGLELARKVRQHFPKLPILLASGYSQAAAEVAEEGFALIAKPYRADSLSDALRQAETTATLEQRNSA